MSQQDSSQDPYVSFVVCGRNDDYGGNFLQRVNNFINSISVLSNKYSVNTEIIFVEWNPCPDKKMLWQEINEHNKVIKSFGQTVKFIIVPAEHHLKYKNNPNHHYPVLDYVGKNVGIRRSKGKFTLVCSPDTVFTDNFFERLRDGFFSDKYVYRTCRADYHPIDATFSNYEEYTKYMHICKSHVYSWNIEHGMSISDNSVDRILLNNLYTNGCGDFLMASKDAWVAVKGCPEISDVFCHLDTKSLVRLSKIREQWILPYSACVYHQNHHRPHFYHEQRENHDNEPIDECWGSPDVEFETIDIKDCKS